ncbi:MAG: BMP family ABC transporter substrate-binding protein [Oscillibacter sp.]|nr:BMP family ABC transporter substrate-binding protein [Oscillibacter sp.]
MKTGMKKMGALLLCLAMLLALLAGCGGKETGQQDTGSGSSAPPEAEAKKVVLVTPQKLGDKACVDLSWAGVQAGCEQYGWEAKVIEAEEGEYEDAMRSMAEEGYDLIIGLFSATQDAVIRTAPDYPDTKFFLINGEAEGDNIQCAQFWCNESSFLCGVAAAMKTQTGKIAAIRGADVGDNIRFTAGFFHGARTVNPDIECVPMIAGSFEDPTKGKELAMLAMEQGCDIIMQICAKTSMGIREALTEAGKDKLYVGIDTDESDNVPGQVLGTSATGYDTAIINAIGEVDSGNFQTGIIWHGLADGGVYMIETDLCTPEIMEAVHGYEEKIINGEIQVDATTNW